MQHGPGMHGGVTGMVIILGVIVTALAFLAWKIIHRRRRTNSEETKGQDSSEE